MTKEVRILRDALKIMTRYGGWTLNVAELAKTAIKQADAIKDGPSDEDRETLLKIYRYHRIMGTPCDHDVKWLVSKLQKYMGIE